MTYDACFCDYDAPEFCTTKMVRARKQHRCEECGADIKTGDKYEYTFGKWDGYTDYFKVCTLCLELREWAKISVPCFCWAYGNLHDDVRNMVDEVEHDVPGLMFEWGRRMIEIERRKYGQHWPRKRHSPANTIST